MRVFFEMIRELRLNRKLSVASKLLPFSTIEEIEEEDVVDFLHKEYLVEAYEYPFNAPDFNPEGAIFGAKSLYIAAHLLIDRELEAEKAANLFPELTIQITPAIILSADLSLRFIPDIVYWLKAIDSEDPLILLLTELLKKWHYSGIRYLETFDDIDLSVIQQDPCLEQMYTDRLIKYNKQLIGITTEKI